MKYIIISQIQIIKLCVNNKTQNEKLKKKPNT